MNKRDITEAGIKLIAFFTLLRSTIVLITVTLNALLGGAQSVRAVIITLIAAIIPIVLCVVVIRKADWVLDRMYKVS